MRNCTEKEKTMQPLCPCPPRFRTLCSPPIYLSLAALAPACCAHGCITRVGTPHPRFLQNMPASYFRQTSEEARLQHLGAISSMLEEQPEVRSFRLQQSCVVAFFSPCEGCCAAAVVLPYSLCCTACMVRVSVSGGQVIVKCEECTAAKARR